MPLKKGCFCLLQKVENSFLSVSHSSNIFGHSCILKIAQINDFLNFSLEFCFFLAGDWVAGPPLRFEVIVRWNIVDRRTLNINSAAFLDECLSFSFKLFSDGIVGVIGSACLVLSISHYNDKIIICFWQINYSIQ